MDRLRLMDGDSTVVLDLLKGPLRLLNWGWDHKPTSLSQRAVQLPYGVQATSQGYTQTTETFSLGMTGCESDIRAATQVLDNFLENVAANMDDPLVNAPQWLEWTTESENRKRALVVGGAWSPVIRPGTWPMLSTRTFLLQLVVGRHQLWENTVVSTDSLADMDTIGGIWPFVATPGRAPARISMLTMAAAASMVGVANATVTTAWIGIRPEYEGLAAYAAIPIAAAEHPACVWECEDHTQAGAPPYGPGRFDEITETANLADATASNGWVAQTTFADTVLKKRFHLKPYSVLDNGHPDHGTTLNARHFAGRYLILARCHIVNNVYFLKTVNVGVAYTDYSAQVSDCDITAASVADLGSLDTFANGDWFLVGARDQFTSVDVSILAPNINTPTALTGYYWDGAAWVILPSGITDGTINPANTTLGQSGTISWTNPGTAWAEGTFGAAPAITAYWIQFRASGAGTPLDATTTIHTCRIPGAAKGSASIQMRYGYEDSTLKASYDMVSVDNDLPRWKELGIIQIPPPGLWGPTATSSLDEMCSAATIDIYSQNADVYSMSIDCLQLIPADFALKVEYAKVQNIGGVEYITNVIRMPDERMFGYIENATGSVVGAVTPSPTQWYLPTGNSLMVVAAERATEQVKADEVDMAIEYFRRWTDYRE
jgi:hypothetical protein